VATIDQTHLVEYLDEMALRLGVTFAAVSVLTEAGFDEENCTVTARGELRAVSGNEINRNVQIVVTVYDTQKRVIGTSSTTVNADEFYGFEAFEVGVAVPLAATNVEVVRVYPKKW
jgi:hypothetical protein